MRFRGIVAVLCLLSAGCAAHVPDSQPDPPEQNRPEVDAAALKALLARAAEEKSSAVAISFGGELIAMRGDDEPMSAMSASKSVASLAVGFLVGDGLLALDDPVAKWVPEWRDTPHAAIQVRHLLNHTSGLRTARADLRTGDIAAHGTSSPLGSEPGARFLYNNNAVDLLAVIVGRVAGRPLDQLLQERLFGPLGIRDATWVTDINGVPFAAGELQIRPTDLLKVGQLLAEGGIWQGRRLISREWIETSTDQSQEHMPSYGLLWWREGEFRLALTRGVLDQWREAAVPADILAEVEPLEGETFEGYRDFKGLLVGKIGEDGFERWTQWIRSSRGVTWATQVQVGPARGFSARGWLGQFLVVDPETGIVAVRMRRPEQQDFGGGPERYAFPSFPAEVLALQGDL